MEQTLWLGSEESYKRYLAWQAASLDPKAASLYEEDIEPELYRREGNVGIIDVKGSLINGRAGYGRYFGMMGYTDIEDAIIEAVRDQKTKAIMLDVSSPGGSVAGVQDAGELISRVAQVKPMVTFTGGMMASAALWLGSSTGIMVAAPTAQVGSLGVMMVMAERSKQLEKDGINVKVIRAGKYKTLGNPYEPMSQEAIDEAQRLADGMYDIFLSHVASMRKMPENKADKQFGQGRMFLAQEARELGLIDVVGGFSAAYTLADRLASK